MQGRYSGCTQHTVESALKCPVKAAGVSLKVARFSKSWLHNMRQNFPAVVFFINIIFKYENIILLHTGGQQEGKRWRLSKVYWSCNFGMSTMWYRPWLIILPLMGTGIYSRYISRSSHFLMNPTESQYIRLGTQTFWRNNVIGFLGVPSLGKQTSTPLWIHVNQ